MHIVWQRQQPHGGLWLSCCHTPPSLDFCRCDGYVQNTPRAHVPSTRLNPFMLQVACRFQLPVGVKHRFPQSLWNWHRRSGCCLTPNLFATFSTGTGSMVNVAQAQGLATRCKVMHGIGVVNVESVLPAASGQGRALTKYE